jgi:hypothetical protein
MRDTVVFAGIIALPRWPFLAGDGFGMTVCPIPSDERLAERMGINSFASGAL